MDETVANYRWLDSKKIIETVQALQRRIESRFPGSGLGKVVTELLQVAQETVARTQWIQKPHLPLRFAAALLSLSSKKSSTSAVQALRAGRANTSSGLRRRLMSSRMAAAFSKSRFLAASRISC